MSPLEKSIFLFKNGQNRHITHCILMSQFFFVILNGVRTVNWQISHYLLIQMKYMHKKHFWTTLMSWVDTNYLSSNKTNGMPVTEAKTCLNYWVPVVLWLETKFDGNHFGYVTFFVMDNLKCPGVTRNHEVISLGKHWHIQARPGSQMSVVTI